MSETAVMDRPIEAHKSSESELVYKSVQRIMSAPPDGEKRGGRFTSHIFPNKKNKFLAELPRSRSRDFTLDSGEDITIAFEAEGGESPANADSYLVQIRQSGKPQDTKVELTSEGAYVLKLNPETNQYERTVGDPLHAFDNFSEVLNALR
jgi:hypothetical protein